MLGSKATQAGIGQTWQAVTRTAGTTYTNSTGKPIFFAISGMTQGAACGITITVAGIVAGSTECNAAAGGQPLSLSALIPPGATYLWNFSGSAPVINAARELR